jgi:hypothetical protein
MRNPFGGNSGSALDIGEEATGAHPCREGGLREN